MTRSWFRSTFGYLEDFAEFEECIEYLQELATFSGSGHDIK